ncbi:MAG TPA: hypothetical protein VF898_11910 [Chloroflexota bacterium]
MRTQRHDITILLVCGIPIIIGVALAANYLAFGAAPFGLPSLSIPTITLPQEPDIERYLPSPLVDFIHFAQQNTVSVILAFAVGSLALVMASGIYVDFAHARRNSVNVVSVDDDDDIDEPYHAPWLRQEDARSRQ